MRTETSKAAFGGAFALAVLIVPLLSVSAHSDMAKPVTVLQQIVDDMPTGAQQEVRVLTATLNPGDQTVFHTHRFPVSVYILSGTFTLEMDGRDPVTLQAGEAMVEPPNVRMTGYNRSQTEPTKVVIFYASDPETPFLDLIE